MFWNTKYEWNMGDYLSNVLGVSTISPTGRNMLEIARCLKSTFKDGGIRPQVAAVCSLNMMILVVGEGDSKGILAPGRQADTLAFMERHPEFPAIIQAKLAKIKRQGEEADKILGGLIP